MSDIPMNNRIRESLAQFRRAKAIADETRAVDPASKQHLKALDSLDVAAYVLALAVSAAVDAESAPKQSYPRHTNMLGDSDLFAPGSVKPKHKPKSKRLTMQQKLMLRHIASEKVIRRDASMQDKTLRSLVNRGLVLEMYQQPLPGHDYGGWLEYTLTAAGRERVR